MRKTMTTSVDVFLPDVTTPGVSLVQWTEPYELPNSEAGWYTSLRVETYPHGSFAVSFYGTEEQVKAIRGGGS